MNEEPIGNETDKQWERDTIRELLLEVYKERKRKRLNNWGKWLLFGLFIFIFIGGFSGKASNKGEHTAVVRLEGPIMWASDTTKNLVTALERAFESKDVKGIIIEANSPGGSAVLSDVAFQEITRLRKEHPKIPLHVVMGDVCASGCYYIASAADKLYANPSTLVGSIGAIMGGFGFDKALDKMGIERRVITAGEHKAMGDPFSPENPEERQMFQDDLDVIHKHFIAKVKEGRGDRLKTDQDSTLFSGRIYTGEEAVSLGLVDEIGSVYTVSRDVFKAPTMVDYTVKENYFDRAGKYLGAFFGTWAELGDDAGVKMR